MESFQPPRLPALSCLSEASLRWSGSARPNKLVDVTSSMLCLGACSPPAASRQKLAEMTPQSARALDEYQSWSIRQCSSSTLHAFAHSTTTGVVACAY